MERFLIRNTAVAVTMDPTVGDMPNVDISIVNGKIEAIGQGLVDDAAECIDATGMVALPGFVDTHRHTYQALVPGLLPSCTLTELCTPCWAWWHLV